MTRDDIKARIARQFQASPQATHLATSALDEVFNALDRLQALGAHFHIAPALVSQHVPQEWPQWRDGVLWQDEEHYKAGQVGALPPPVRPAEEGSIELEGKVPLQAAVVEDKDEVTLPPVPSTWVIVPTVHENRLLSDAQALEQYRASGAHFGKFVDKASADRYLVWLESNPKGEAGNEIEPEDFGEDGDEVAGKDKAPGPANPGPAIPGPQTAPPTPAPIQTGSAPSQQGNVKG